jgi:hypothetical protein
MVSFWIGRRLCVSLKYAHPWAWASPLAEAGAWSCQVGPLVLEYAYGPEEDGR